jgi:hypothetical protein
MPPLRRCYADHVNRGSTLEKTKSYRISDFTSLEITCRDCGAKLTFKMSNEKVQSQITAILRSRRTCAACGSIWLIGQNDVRYQALEMILDGLFEARRHEAVSDGEVESHHDVPRVLVSVVAPDSD